MTREQAKEIALRTEPIFLPKARVGYVCPCPDCRNGAGSSGTGIQPIPNRGKDNDTLLYHCFKCDSTFDIFDMAKIYYGLDSFPKAAQAVYDALGIKVDDVEVSREYLERIKPVIEVEPERTYVDQVDYIKECAKRLDPSYLEKRGISEKTQRHYMVGFDPYWRNPITVERRKSEGKDPMKIPWSPRCIIPTGRQSYLARDSRPNPPKFVTEDGVEIDTSKQKYGHVPLYNEKFASQKNQDVVFVLEGEIDAMSIYEATGGELEAVGLGSTSNVKLLLQSVMDGDLKNVPMFAIMMDNDAAGKEATKKIIEGVPNKNLPGLKELGVPYHIVTFEVPDNGKDANEYLQRDREGLTACIYENLDQARKELAQIREQNKEDKEP